MLDLRDQAFGTSHRIRQIAKTHALYEAQVANTLTDIRVLRGLGRLGCIWYRHVFYFDNLWNACTLDGQPFKQEGWMPQQRGVTRPRLIVKTLYPNSSHLTDCPPDATVLQ